MKNKLDETISRSSSDHKGDEQLEAFTQTDAFTVCKELASACKESTGLTTNNNQIPIVDKPLKRKRQPMKTPNSIMKLMEKHRESERQRHHSLNRQLHLICEKVPGFAVEGKETKVVMMQRIIGYIAYLENTVKIICNRLNVKCDSLWFLTRRIKQMKWSDPMMKDFHSMESEDSRDSSISSLSMSRLLSLSSPTVDLPTEHDSRDSAPDNDSKAVHEELTEDEIAVRGITEDRVDFKRIDTEWFINEEDGSVVDQQNASFYPLLDVSADDQAVFEVPTSSFEVGLMDTGEVKWLGSPDKYSFYGTPKTGKGDVSFGIKFDPQLLDESINEFCHSDIVSPDQVLPQLSIKQEVVETYNDSHESAVVMDRSKEQSCSIDRCSVPKSADLMEMYKDQSLSIDRCNDSQSADVMDKFRERSCSIDRCSDSQSAHVMERYKDQSCSIDRWTDETDNQVVPQTFSRRKQSTPKKNSHQDLTLCELPIEFTDYIGNVDGSFNPTSGTENRMVGSFMEVESSSTSTLGNCNQDFDLLEELARIREKVLVAARHEHSSKQDLRRSSWLNGFMMYSCIHRKRFIRDNPGVHTAHISKLVGQAWREMTEEQKSPYREQATICSQELQSILDKKHFV